MNKGMLLTALFAAVAINVRLNSYRSELHQINNVVFIVRPHLELVLVR